MRRSNKTKEFTMEDAVEIQKEQLKKWEYKLVANLFNDLRDECERKNKTTTNPYHVFRGTDMDCFIANWKP